MNADKHSAEDDKKIVIHILKNYIIDKKEIKPKQPSPVRVIGV